MFRTMDDVFQGLTARSDATLKIFRALTDESLSASVADDHRTLGGMAWHIVTTLPEMMNQCGLGLSAVDHRSMPPSTAADIVAGYEAAVADLRTALEGWTDADLTVTDELYGETWPRGLTLFILFSHEVHHLGQMTVLMRQAGLVVPGVYGPAKEEWAAYGMEQPPY